MYVYLISAPRALRDFTSLEEGYYCCVSSSTFDAELEILQERGLITTFQKVEVYGNPIHGYYTLQEGLGYRCLEDIAYMLM